MITLAIDPGNIESAYVLVGKDLRPLEFGKINNCELLNVIEKYKTKQINLVIERIASYGMGVGKEVFETCEWVGRFVQCSGRDVNYIYRKDVKMHFCHSMKAKDSNIIQALKDRFGDKGTVKNPGWFFGFKKDVWQAYAVGVTYIDMQKERAVNNAANN